MGGHDAAAMLDQFCEHLRFKPWQVLRLPVVAPALRLGRVQQALLRYVRSPLNDVADRRAEGFDRSDHRFAFAYLASVTDKQRDNTLAMHLFGKPWHWRSDAQRRNACEFRWSLLGQSPVHLEHAASVLSAPGDCASHNFRSDRIELVLEICHDAEVAAAAPETPEQVAVFFVARAHHAP